MKSNRVGAGLGGVTGTVVGLGVPRSGHVCLFLPREFLHFSPAGARHRRHGTANGSSISLTSRGLDRVEQLPPPAHAVGTPQQAGQVGE